MKCGGSRDTHIRICRWDGSGPLQKSSILRLESSLLWLAEAGALGDGLSSPGGELPFLNLHKKASEAVGDPGAVLSCGTVGLHTLEGRLTKRSPAG